MGANQATINGGIDVMQEKIDHFLEAVMAMSRKGDNPQIIVDARNISS